MKAYDHTKIERKWQQTWQEEGIYKTKSDSDKEKCFVLDMFPYPSGEGLHVGHPKGYIATDVYSRFKKMSGCEVLHPMGWDAFGLPAENFAIKNKVHPRIATERNIANFKAQLEKLGFNYDWSREINTTDPAYYKWTQWIFLQLFKKGLAYESHEPINWCPSCQTGLANEDLESDGTCERCDSVVEKRPMRQWVLKITDYADRLLEDLALLEQWPEHIKEAQRNWIGKSEGAEISFTLNYGGSTAISEDVSVFTTRPDTLFGATYLVLAPEHHLVPGVLSGVENREEVEKYIAEAQQRSEMDRLDATKEKTGVELKGVSAVNPATKEEIPVFVADYVLAHYGTGAIMAVPAHDERDFAFAKKFSLPIQEVLVPECIDTNNPPVDGKEKIERQNVHAYVVDPKTGKVLCLRWKNHPWVTFPMGGIEDGESLIEAARREVLEETGYTSLSEGRVCGGAVRAEYFAAHKDQNRISYTNLVYFELTGDVQEQISEEEAAMHDVVWLDPKEVTVESMSHAEMDVWLERLNTPASEDVYTGKGVLRHSGDFSGLDSEEAKRAITEHVGGTMTSTYRLNDWVFSRQRYWGEPIPIIHCEKCGAVPVPEEQLPVELPEVEHYEPTGTGESPLAAIDEWVNTTCPECDGSAKRETNTMPQWAGSSWYYLRFIDPNNAEQFVAPDKEKKWMPVDVYVGGDHAVRHLIYARFWHKFLYDEGHVSTPEPFERLEFLGFILAEDGRKMSKRWGNIINPDDIVKTNGADALRVYEMFMSPFENTTAWSTDGLVGAQRFLERVWRLRECSTSDVEHSEEVERALHKTIKKVGEDIEQFKFNTAIAQMMTFANVAYEHGITKQQLATFTQLLAPFAPHLTEELWREVCGNSESVHMSAWPSYDETLLVSDTVTIAVQINGKLRGEVSVAADADERTVRDAVAQHPQLSAKLAKGEPERVIFVPERLINFVMSE